MSSRECDVQHVRPAGERHPERTCATREPKQHGDHDDPDNRFDPNSGKYNDHRDGARHTRRIEDSEGSYKRPARQTAKELHRVHDGQL
jgi:hypothetical protein